MSLISFGLCCALLGTINVVSVLSQVSIQPISAIFEKIDPIITFPTIKPKFCNDVYCPYGNLPHPCDNNHCCKDCKRCIPKCPYGYKLELKYCLCRKCKPLKKPCKDLIKCKSGKIALQVVDKHGCPKCSCCPAFICLIFCMNGNARDKDGCPICKCRKCPEQSCAAACQNGYIVDENGCETCNCKPCPLIKCARRCRYGFLLGCNGCQTCNCRKCRRRHCRPCKNGYKLNSKGCPTCKCKKACVIIPCPIRCRWGLKIDENGCQLCECNPEPITLAKTYPTMPTKRTIIPVTRPCPLVKCAACEFGYKLINGCQSCECEDPPMTMTTCEP